jgi:hypothetical protein
LSSSLLIVWLSFKIANPAKSLKKWRKVGRKGTLNAMQENHAE